MYALMKSIAAIKYGLVVDEINIDCFVASSQTSQITAHFVDMQLWPKGLRYEHKEKNVTVWNEARNEKET